MKTGNFKTLHTISTATHNMQKKLKLQFYLSVIRLLKVTSWLTSVSDVDTCFEKMSVCTAKSVRPILRF